jgi:hypothetical protein
MKLTFPIIENQKKPWSGLIVTTYLSCFLLLIINLVFFKNMILNYIIIGMVILLGFIIGIVKNDTISGKIVVDEKLIVIKGKEYKIEELEFIEIIINGFEGRKGIDNIKSFYSDDGKNNYFKISKNKCITKYQIILSEKNFNLILLLDKNWKHQNVKIILNGN